MDLENQQRDLNAAADFSADSVIPIAILVGGSQLASIGSGVLITTESEACVVTAAHVVDDAKGQALLTRNSNGDVFALGSVGMRTPEPPQGLLDAADLAVIQIDPAAAAAMDLGPDSTRLLRESTLSDACPSDATYVAIGYPASRNKWQSERAVFGGRDMVLGYEEYFAFANAAAFDTYESNGCEPALHLITVFDHSRTKIDGDDSGFPHPRGMSGGGLFCLSRKGSAVEQPMLVGICTRYVEPRRLIVATRATLVRQILASLTKA